MNRNIHKFLILVKKIMERKYKNSELNPSEWSLYNKNTKEFRDPKGRLTESYPQKGAIVQSKSYLYLDVDRLKILHALRISQVELGFLMLISTNLMSYYNICRNEDDKPHTADSIGKLIGESRQNAKRKLDSLVDKNILAQVTYPDLKHLKKVYAVNPHILRKGKDLSEYLFNIFYDFVKKEQSKSVVSDEALALESKGSIHL
jgi:hypothetical protein